MRHQGSALSVEVISDRGEAGSLSLSWHDLAVALGQPTALPGWQLAWWDRFAPAGGQLRLVVVRDRERLVGVVPAYVEPGRRGAPAHRLLASAVTQRVGLLAEPADAPQIMRLAVEALARSRPAAGVLALDGVEEVLWLPSLRAAWPGRRPWVLTYRRMPAPQIEIGDASYDDWFARQSRNLRKQARRIGHRLDDLGARFRVASVDGLEHDIDAFLRLHHGRWADRGGSSLHAGIGAMLRDAGVEMIERGAFRLWLLELDDEPIAAQLMLLAGDSATAWNCGFDARHAKLRPGLLVLLAAIEDCVARGVRTIDLGGGDHEYKLRLADRDAPLAWSLLVPRGRGYAEMRLRTLPLQAKTFARVTAARLPSPWRERLDTARAALRM